jgi:Tol biopolymer transport system component
MRPRKIKASMKTLMRVGVGACILSCGDGPTAPFTDSRGLLLVVGGAGAAAEIFAMRPDGTEKRQLTHNNVMDTDPDWSPDGSKIVFVSLLDSTPGAPTGRPEIYVMNADGSGMRRLLRSEVAWHPRWSPDGTRISFHSLDRSVGRFLPYVMNSDGSNVRVVGSHPADTFYLEWSPDGSRFLFISNRCPRCYGTVYVMPIDGSSEQQLTDDAICVTNVSIAQWSPDGSRIAYSCDTDPSGFFIMRSDGTGSTRLTSSTENGAMYGLAWSPDGTQLAFTSNRGSSFFTPVWHVNVIDATGGPASEVTTGSVIEFVSDWGPRH